MNTHALPWPSVLAQAETQSKSLVDYIADGGQIGMIIILLSLVAITLIVAQFLQVRSARLAPPEAVSELDRFLSAGDVDHAIAYTENPDHNSFLARVMSSALVRCSRSPFGFLELRSAIEEAGQRETAKLYRLTDAIGLIAAIAPMLGLLGTVVGMVGAFDTLTLADGPARPDQLAGNISQALVTTVLGLIVAIPATAAHTFLRNRVDALTTDVGEIIEDLAAHLESASGAKPTGAPAQGAPRP
ncbi:MAG: biopolymer transporter ExbB [Phycisphaeraceae bacterium]|nr:MAG: biopolymer transporter ExbB [Phycisphaeraceae bacterium]